MKTYKQYYQENRERLRKRNREYYHTHKEKFIERKRKNYEKILTIKREQGGKCQLCGYDKNLAVLQFHHINGDKKFNVSYMSHKPLKEIRIEAAKCQLICANCHIELHHPVIAQQVYGEIKGLEYPV